MESQAQEQRPVQRRNNFTDAQQDASRLTFNEDLSQSQPPDLAPSARFARQVSPMVLPSRSSTGVVPSRRSHTVMAEEDEDDGDYDPSQDTGFQNDGRHHPAPVRRRMDPPERPRQKPRRPMGDDLYVDVDDIVPPASARTQQQSVTSLPRRNPGPTQQHIQYEPTLDGPQRTLADELNERRNDARMISSQYKRPPRARVPWSPTEVEALLNYIEREGTEYAMIKRTDSTSVHALEQRTAEDLRFKARGLKEEWLLADHQKQVQS